MTDLNELLKKVSFNLDNKQFKESVILLKELEKSHPNHPWVLFYKGRYYELNHQRELATKIYRKVLQTTTNPKIITQARQGLQRIETLEKEEREAAVNQTKSDPKQLEPGLLILEPVPPDHKLAASQKLAKILNVDAYTARMQLQSRGFRLYKTGPIGELSVYGQELLKAGIPVFWKGVNDLQKIHIFRVCHFQSISPQPTVVCLNSLNQMGALSFQWSEITQRVEGLLPIFMEIMDYVPHRRKEKFQHKEITQDYAQIWDLHLPKRNCILRICEQSYEFQKGIPMRTNPSENQTLNPNTTRMKWNNLTKLLKEQHPHPQVWSEFTAFAETALDYPFLLERFTPFIDIERKSETPWDPAFQLYSTLIFMRNQSLYS